MGLPHFSHLSLFSLFSLFSQHTAIHYDRFVDFVTTPPSKGLGTTIDLIRRIVADDPVTLDLLDQALVITPGQHRVHDNVSSTQGNSATHALRRLRRERPDLHARVLTRDLSPHAADEMGAEEAA